MATRIDKATGENVGNRAMTKIFMGHFSRTDLKSFSAQGRNSKK